MKAKLLQVACVRAPSDQSSVLVPTVGELENQSVGLLRMAAMEEEVQRPSLAHNPMPAEHLPRSPAAAPPVSPLAGRQRSPGEQKSVVLLEEHFLFKLSLQLQQAARRQEAAKAEVLEKEAKIQELRDTITELHHEISQMDWEALSQLRDKSHLETQQHSFRWRQEQQQGLGVGGGEAVAAGSSPHKSPLSSCGSREFPERELPAQEQRICERESQQKEAQAGLEQRKHQAQSLEDEPEAGQRHQEEPCQQLTDCYRKCPRAESEKVLQRGCRWERREKREGWAPSQKQDWGSPCVEMQAVPLRGEEGELARLCGKLASTQAEVEALWAELHDTHLLAEGATAQLAVAETEAAVLRGKYRLALEEAVERSQALCSLQESHGILQQHMVEREALLRQLEIQTREQLANLQRAQEEVGQQRELLSAEQRKSQALKEELQERGRELNALREALREAKEQREEQRQAEVQATQDQLARCQEQLLEAQAQHQWLAWDGAVWREQQKAFQETLAGKEVEVSSLQARLCRLQEEPRGLQEPKMVEQTQVIHRLLHEKEDLFRQSSSSAALREQLQDGGQGSLRMAHQPEMEELQGKLQRLQQELDVCKGRNQENLSKLQARECAMEKQGLDLDLLLQQCQALKDQLFYYEDVAQKQELAITHQHERERHLQEQLGQAKGSATLLEENLALYKQKYQASLARARELESCLQRLEEELASQAQAREAALLKLQAEQLVWQEELERKCHQAGRAEAALERLAQELHDAQREVSQGRQLACRFEETVQELQEELSDSHAKLLEQEGALAALRGDFASYKATHSCSNSSYESQALRIEALQQKLQEAKADSTECERKAEEYQDLVQDLKLELVRVAEQKSSALKGLAHLELTAESLRQEATTERERWEAEAAVLQQRVQQLEVELGQSHQLCARQEQALRKRNELLHKSQIEMVRARSTLQEKGQELEQQRAQAQRLEAALREAQQALEDSRTEGAMVLTEAQALRQSLRESQEQHQQAAQELARQEEQLLLAQNSLRTAQEQLEERVAEVVLHTQAARRLEAEVQVLSEQAARAEEELEQKRDLLQRLTDELNQSQRQHQAAAQEAQQQRQEAARLERKLESSREGLRGLQQQVQGHESVLEGLRAELSRQRQREDELRRQLQEAQERESQLARSLKDLQRQLQSSQCQLQEEEWKNQGLQLCVTEREAETRALQEQLKQQALELEAVRGSLEGAQLQLQQQMAEALRQEATLSQLHTELHTAQERERQNHQALMAAQGLTAQAVSCQATQREAVEKLEEKAREASCLQAELQLAQHKVGHLEDQVARTQEQLQELMAVQKDQEQEACDAEDWLRELGSQVQYWQKEHRAAKLALEEKDEELVVTKVELAAAEERCHSIVEEREELQNEANLLRQKFVISSREVESLQTSLEAARSDSHRLQRESELVMANVSQWVKEQKQVNEKLGHKIRDQIKQMAQLTGERDHLQGLTERLEQENKRLKNEVDERRIECERLKALHGHDSDAGAAWRQPTLPAESSLWLVQRRSKALATKWDLS